MAEEPRRSGRATKGQYNKDRDIAEGAAAKKKGKGKGSKAKPVEEEEEEEEEELIRCICGTYEEEEDVPRAMICCDNCSAWQHNECMGLPEDYEVDKYFCEQCKPEEHQDLLAAIERGEKPWEDAAKQRELAQTSKKKGKKGRKSTAAAVTVVAAPEPVVVEEATPTRGGQKRKAEETPVAELKNKKVRGTPAAENGTRATSQSRKASTPAAPPPKPTPIPGLPNDPSELTNTIRRGAAQGLVKLFHELVKETTKKGLYKLPSGTNAHDLGLQIGLQVEKGLYGAYSQDDEPTNEYREQLRSIMFNLKKNVDLALSVIKGTATPDQLATMTAKEMQSEEQQRKDAALMKEMEKQHEIVQEQQGPRIRRTHKGEEYVDDAHRIGPESATTNAPNRKPSTPAQETDGKRRESGTKGRQPLSVNTQAKPTPSAADLRRKSSANFDIDKVFSGVQGSPDAETPRFPEVDQRGSPPPQAGANNDPDIDHLLKDEENESEPYSPKEFDDEGVVWRGVVNGNSLGRFHTFAKYAAGATPEADSLRLTWSQVIPSEIQIHGRIQPQKADEYLCGLEYSSTSDMIVVTMAEPRDATNLEGFDRFFKYLKMKQRYGVGMQHSNPAIKDIYLLPMDVGQALPTFMKLLETNFPDPVTERMLLVPIVIKNSELPHNQNASGQPNVMSPSVGPGAVAQTPITPQEGRADMPPQYGNVVPYPYAQGQSGPNGNSSTPAPPTGRFGSPPPPYSGPPASVVQPSPSSQSPSPAVAAAIRVLGAQLAACPAVQSLCQQAPNVGDQEMEVVRECLRENERASQDLSVLTMMLQARSRSAQQQQKQTAPTQQDGAQPSQVASAEPS